MKKKLRLLFLFAALLLAPVLLGNAASGGVVSWGVCPNREERTPQPPAGGAKLLAEHGGLFVGDTAQKKIFLTFDLGYEAGYTEQALDTLKEHSLQAVFFLCGNYLKETALVRRMLREGHAVGNHTDRHKDLPTLPDGGIRKDIGDFQDKYGALYGGEPPRFFRPPAGRFCPRTLTIAQSMNLKTMLWSIAIVDWGKTPLDPAANAAKIAARLHPGAILLLHIVNANTPELLRLLLPQITQKGYQIGTPAELG